MTEIITDAKIAEILGISVDANLTTWNIVATEYLAKKIGVTDFISHLVVNERVKPFSCEYLVLDNFPLVSISSIKNVDLEEDTDFDTATFYSDPNELRRVYAKDSDDSRIYFIKNKEYLISYTAGYADSANTPEDLKMAVAQLVGSGLQEKDLGKGIAEKKLGDFTLKYKMDMGSFAERSPLVDSVIKSYKKYVAIV